MTARFAYADPPYVGQSDRYPEHPAAARWDDPAEHCALMAELADQYDGWALSCSTPSLGPLLAGAPPGTRVAAWVKPWAAYKRNVRVVYTWEPVLFARTLARRPDEPVGRDHLSAGMTMRRGLTGAKPAAFGRWLVVLLGALPDDEWADVFPGTGAVGDQLAVPRLL